MPTHCFLLGVMESSARGLATNHTRGMAMTQKAGDGGCGQVGSGAVGGLGSRQPLTLGNARTPRGQAQASEGRCGLSVSGPCPLRSVSLSPLAVAAVPEAGLPRDGQGCHSLADGSLATTGPKGPSGKTQGQDRLRAQPRALGQQDTEPDTSSSKGCSCHRAHDHSGKLAHWCPTCQVMENRERAPREPWFRRALSPECPSMMKGSQTRHLPGHDPWAQILHHGLSEAPATPTCT